MPNRRPVALPASVLAGPIAALLLVGTALAHDPTVIVQPGDTLSRLAVKHGTTVHKLAVLNGINNPDLIYAGQTLRLATGPAAAAAAGERIHLVRRGEHLTGIARAYGSSVAAIAAANGITNPSLIFAGQRLTIPGAVPPAAARDAAVAPSLAPATARLMAARGGVRGLIMEEAAHFGVPTNLALAVAWQESGWRQGVVSSAGAIGVMQLLPSTAEWVGVTMLGAPVDPYDARANVRAGCRLLAHYLDRYGGDRPLALAAYYQGQTAVDRRGIYTISRPYINAVLAMELMLGG